MALRSLKSLKRHRMMSDINVVPYIDVMLVLVVILMVAAPFVNPSVVNLPSVSKAASAPRDPIEVVVHADGHLSLKARSGLRPVDIVTLISNVRLIQDGADVPVVIAADRDVRYEQVVNVMNALQSAEVKRVGLALRVERPR